jgi:ankyrin repeat protein
MTTFILIFAFLAAPLGRADVDQDRALREAAYAGRITDVQRQLSGGARVDGTSVYGQTALMSAAIRGNDPVIEALLKAHADPDLRNPSRAASMARSWPATTTPTSP